MSTPAERLALLESAVQGAGGERAVLAALEDGASAVRERAIRLAARYVEPAVLGELVADGQNAVRRNAGLAALERQGLYAVPHLVAMLDRPDAELVMFALQSLSRIGSTSAGSAILPLLDHPDPNVAQAAIEAAGRLRVREAAVPLCRLLRGDLWLQLAAIVALGEIGDPEAVGPLMAFIPDSVLAEPAVQSLRLIAAPESLEPLLMLLPTVHEHPLRDALVLALAVILELHPDPAEVLARAGAGLAGGDVTGYLRQAVSTPPETGDGGEAEGLVRAAAALVVATGIESLQPLLLARLASDESAGWMEGLFRRFPEALAPRLPALLDDTDPDVRRGALRAGSFDETDVTTVIHHLGDPHAPVRAAACLALGRIGLDASAPLLVERLRRGEPPEQAAAAQALGQLSEEAMGEIDSCLQPECDESVVVHALEVLARRPVAGFEARVLQLVEDRRPPVRLAAFRAAAPIPGARCDVALLRALADRHQPIQREALTLLAQRGGEKSVATLVALLGTADSSGST